MVLGREKEIVVRISARVSVYVRLKGMRSVIYYVKVALVLYCRIYRCSKLLSKATVCVRCPFRSSLLKKMPVIMLHFSFTHEKMFSRRLSKENPKPINSFHD